jgi:hypothetical protein
MKTARSVLLPVVCFAASWMLATWLSRQFSQPPVPDPQVSTRSARPRPQQVAGKANRVAIEQLAEDFKTRPMAEWAERWEEFASQATLADLAAIPRTLGKPHGLSNRRDDSNVLRVLAQEELAQRAAQPAALEPCAYAALAEKDPEEAWRSLAKNLRSDLTMAVLRTAAQRDPAGTLRRFQAMPTPVSMERSYERDAGEGGMAARTCVGTIFAAWARRDPATAAAEAMKLPPTDRKEAIGEVVMTWAYHDGPAALQSIQQLLQANDSSICFLRVEETLRALLRSHPTEAARVVAASPSLRKALSERNGAYNCLKSWFDADPDTVLAWVGAPHRRACAENLLDHLDGEPESAARVIRALAAAGSKDAARAAEALYYRYPEQSLALTAELGTEVSLEARNRSVRPELDPERAAARWLEMLAKHGDLDEAVAIQGWNKEDAVLLAARLARHFPEQAKELARQVPAAWLDIPGLGSRRADLARFWPDLPPDPPPNHPSPTAPPPRSAATPVSALPRNQHLLDPGAALAGWDLATAAAIDIEKAVRIWAPYDLAGARNWVSRLPAGEGRQRAEWTIAAVQAPIDPVATLQFLATQAGPEPNQESFFSLGLPTLWNTGDFGISRNELWQNCLRRVLLDGGNWRGWLAKAPPEVREMRMGFPHLTLSEHLAAEARLLDRLRQEHAH